MSTLVAIPVFNGAATLPRLLTEITNEGVKDILVVNDGSDDETAQLLTEQKVTHESHPLNLGKGAAVKTAGEWAAQRGYDWILTLDADLQHPPGSIPLFLEAHEENTIVVGERLNLSPMPLARRFSNKITSLLLSIRTSVSLRDSQCGFRLIPLKLFSETRFFQNGFQFESEMLIKASLAGYRINHVEIPTLYGDEKSAMRNFRDTVKFAAMYLHSFLW